MSLICCGSGYFDLFFLLSLKSLQFQKNSLIMVTLKGMNIFCCKGRRKNVAVVEMLVV